MILILSINKVELTKKKVTSYLIKLYLWKN